MSGLHPSNDEPAFANLGDPRAVACTNLAQNALVDVFLMRVCISGALI